MAAFDDLIANFLNLTQGFQPVSEEVLRGEFQQYQDPYFNQLVEEAKKEAALRTGRLQEDVGTGISRLEQQRGFLGTDIQRGLGRVGTQRGFFQSDIDRARQNQALAFAQQQRGLNQQLGQQFADISGGSPEDLLKGELQRAQALRRQALSSQEQRGLTGFGQREEDLRTQLERGELGFGQRISDLETQQKRGVFDIEDYLKKRNKYIEQQRAAERGAYIGSQQFRNYGF